MALFGGKKEEKKKTVSKTTKGTVQQPAKVAPPKVVAVKIRSVLLRPHVTEKAAQATAKNVYTFDIRIGATKKEIANEIQDMYRVKPVKIAVVNTPGKRVRLRTRRGYGKKNATKKAYVYLKKGDRIEFAS